MITGKLDQDTPAVFITGINSQGIAVTDILVWRGGRQARQRCAGPQHGALHRHGSLSSADAAGTSTATASQGFPGPTALSPTPSRPTGMVFWEQYRPDGLVTVERTYHCLSGGWCFILPGGIGRAMSPLSPRMPVSVRRR